LDKVDKYSTHIPVLRALAKAMPVRRVLEFGSGFYSTCTFLDRAAFPLLEVLVSVETDPRWVEQMRRSIHNDRWLCLHSAPVEALLPGLDDYDLVLVDDGVVDVEIDSPGYSTQRVATIRALANHQPAAVIAIHDYERTAYQRAGEFEHMHIYAEQSPWTAVCWRDSRPMLELLEVGVR
jgi:hypothetical protein